MFTDKDTAPTPPYTKEVLINGQPHRVTVLPPGPEEHNETVWQERKSSLSSGPMPYMSDLDQLVQLFA